MTRLVLLTNEYPYAAGDVSFVQGEIDALAARFDEVVVFCHTTLTENVIVQMPGNVRFAGNLKLRQPEDNPLLVFSPRYFGRICRAAWLELIHGRLRGHVRRFELGVLAGVMCANRADLRAAIESSAETVVYAFWGMGAGLALPWLRGAARVVRLHRYDIYEEQADERYLHYRRYLYRSVDRILTISQHGSEYLAETYNDEGIDDKVVLSRLGASGPDRLERPESSGEWLIVSCSNVSPVKRVDAIWRALRVLKQQIPSRDVRWVHFGDGPLMGQLQRGVNEHASGVRIELRGRIENDDILAFYASNRVDAFVNLSSSEGVPVSIMEAIAHDIPVVATDVGGTSEIVGNTWGTGELVQAGAADEEVATTIATVLRAQDGTYAPRQKWETEFDVRVTAPHAAELVRSLIPW